MTAAILERHGLRTGAYLSPHLVSYSERVQVGEQEMDGGRFRRRRSRGRRGQPSASTARWPSDDHVTQFELLTAAALWDMAERGGGGGGGRGRPRRSLRRHERDRRPVTVLTNVGLEHTRWLGPTVSDIAEEKLAVLASGADARARRRSWRRRRSTVARRVAAERDARIVGSARCSRRGRGWPQGRVPAAQLRAGRAAAGAYSTTPACSRASRRWCRPPPRPPCAGGCRSSARTR